MFINDVWRLDDYEVPPPLPVADDPRFDTTGPVELGHRYIVQRSTGYARWVRIIDINAQGLDVAFYDADPRFVPGGEK
jgi:hypothetical protein